jgi:SAM-dependent methyltransferase
VVSWSAPGGTSSGPRRQFRTLALRQLNPLASRLSPLRHFTDWRVEQYYRRTLTDTKFARDWGEAYLHGLPLYSGVRVLDYGCGRGRHTALLSHLGFAVAAQDIRTHAWWERLPDCVFQAVPPEASRLPWADRTFALVLDVGVIHYLSSAQLSTLGREVLRVLAPNGHWVLVEANDASYGASSIRRIVGRLHSLDSVRAIARQSGFVEVDVSYEGYYAPAFPLFVNFVRKIVRPGAVDLDDFQSSLAARTPPHRRGYWRLRLRKMVNGD